MPPTAAAQMNGPFMALLAAEKSAAIHRAEKSR